MSSSLSTATVPSQLKWTSRTPIHKNSSADPNNFNNYRPISNCLFISKILEKTVATQLEACSLFQMVFRSKHSTKAALVKVTNYLLAADSSFLSILILLGISAAFDTISHSVLCGTNGLSWSS